MHPLLSLALSQPHLLLEHAAAYAGLLGAELSLARMQWRRQLLMGVAAAALFSVALTFAGVALLLWASLGGANMPAPWALWLVPVLPALAGAGCAWAACHPAGSVSFQALHTQLEADAALWRELSAA